ncbi:MAG: hypothetical protein ACPG8W_23305 [Candidatus Promineifilaceae bacterium]
MQWILQLAFCLLAVSCTTIRPLETSTNLSSSPTLEPNGDADVVFVHVAQTAADTYTFHVTVHHNDLGWDDYADGWDVVLPNGAVVQTGNNDSPFTRLLLHPHEAEQPVTRSQSGLLISAEITQVTVRAHDLVHGFGGQEVVVDLTATSGQNFTVEQ